MILLSNQIFLSPVIYFFSFQDDMINYVISRVSNEDRRDHS